MYETDADGLLLQSYQKERTGEESKTGKIHKHMDEYLENVNLHHFISDEFKLSHPQTWLQMCLELLLFFYLFVLIIY